MSAREYRYYCGKTLLTGMPWPMKNAEYAAKYPDQKALRYDGFTMMLARDPITGLLAPVTRIIAYSRTPSRHKCDARCQHAKGRNCECSCGGANHGAGS